MRVLIVGNSSVVGCAFAQHFRQRADVMTAGRRQGDFLFDLSKWEAEPAIDCEFDVVVQVAADFGGRANDDIARAEMVNAVGTLSACRLALRSQAKQYILLSSISATYQPGNPYYGIYGLSKRHGEEVAQFFCAERGIPLTILRPTQIYNATGEARKHQPLLYAMADRAELGQDIDIYGSHDARRNYLYVDDLAEVCWRVLQGRHTGTFTCAHPRSITLREMANAAFAAFGKGGKVHFLTDRPDLDDLPHVYDDDLYRKIDYWPIIDVNEGFRLIKVERETRG